MLWIVELYKYDKCYLNIKLGVGSAAAAGLETLDISKMNLDIWVQGKQDLDIWVHRLRRGYIDK